MSNEQQLKEVIEEENIWHPFASEQEAYNEAFGGITKHNNEVRKKNDLLFLKLQKKNGKIFVKRLKELLEHLEVGHTWMEPNLQIVNSPEGNFNNMNKEFGKRIRGYWCEQWAQGMEGDSWSGFVYIKIGRGKYLKSDFNC